ncbi:paraquat-inducible protein B [Pseudooceanicola antarcticus]|uniref:MCE family protein n=1 Tax=Pseudooceanicola antarcticus TaxID=1247613 RepID=A0A285HMK5_9RHOB|nr:MlaD family protein [Pseudooceanicola antarcticus]PJE27798.1 MCE family protein [Pseudooceanicola antarcticus]SNY36960.1 paraquat-inducible protein B [Pseudooceanicola antarcticus]
MTDLPPDIPQSKLQSNRRTWAERVSLVWLLPLLALAIALGVAWHSYADRGPLIEVSFANAEGVAAGETELRYRDVAVGVVEKVGFSHGLNKVQVFIRIDKDVAPFVDRDSQFWIVRPQVTARGVTGLGTVLSGVYLVGLWDSEPSQTMEHFEGLAQPPLNRDGRDGLRIRLRATSQGALTSDVPIEFRGIEVGHLGRAEVSEDGSTIEADAMIYAPHDRMITSATRFWDTSGFEFSLGPNGANIDFSSVASLLSGGVAFNTVVSGGSPVDPGTVFTVYADEGAARASAFGEGETPPISVTAVFEENVSGLSVDAPVTYGGLRIGRVEAISGLVDPVQFGDSRVRMTTTLQIQPARLGLDKNGPPLSPLDFFAARIEEDGLRARLATASILTGGLKVELAEIPGAAPAALDRDAEPNPVFPTAPGRISDVSASAEGVFERINNLKIEELIDSAINTLDNIGGLAGSEDLNAVPGDVRALLGDAREVIGSEELQALPAQVGAIADQAEALLAALNTEEAARKLSEALDGVSAAAAGVEGAVSGVPGVVEKIDTLAANAADVPLDELAESLQALMDSADAVLGTEGAKALPGQMGEALESLRAVLDELREGGVVANLNETLASARDAAGSIEGAAEGLPALLEQARGVLSRAQTTLRGYDTEAGVGRELRDALREVNRAASALAALARELERNPNSILFGR